jgi:hypothetical protein
MDATDRHRRPLRQIYQTSVPRLTNRRRPAPSSPHHTAPGAVMAERPRNRTSAVARKRRRLFRGLGPWPDTSEALAALARAWLVTTIATVLLLAALAIAPIWDGAIFMQALRDALSGDPQLTQPIDEAPTEDPADRETPRHSLLD